MIHVAITREVRPGSEQEFESKIHEFFHQAHDLTASSDGYLVRPLKNNRYGILRSFNDVEEMKTFYDSDLYRGWDRAIAPLTVGPAVRRRVHGLEAFFRPQGESAPATWKMALLTWVAVNPAVFVSSRVVPALLTLPQWLEFLVVNAFVVVALAWALMPALSRIAGKWLLVAQPLPRFDDEEPIRPATSALRDAKR